jgi:hypothetical protein
MKWLILSLSLAMPFSVQADSSHFMLTDLEKIISDHKIVTIEDALNYLPSSLFERAVMVHTSGSLQPATIQTLPRIILSTADSKFIMTYNGDPATPGYFTFDVIEYDTTTGRFSPAEVAFDPKRVEMPKVNRAPTTCLGCHANVVGIHPHVEVYLGSARSGIYGAFNDRYSQLEIGSLKNFLFNKNENPRYQRVPTPEWNPQTLQFKTNPIYSFGRGLYNLVADAEVKGLKRAPSFWPYRYALIASLECGPSETDPTPIQAFDIQSFIPESVKKKFTQEYAAILKVNMGYVTDQFDRKEMEKNFGSPVPETELQFFQPFEPEAASRLEYLIQNLPDVGVHLEKNLDWLLGYSTFQSPLGHGGSATELLYFNDAFLDPKLDGDLMSVHLQAKSAMANDSAAYVVPHEVKPQICQQLQEKSLKAIQDYNEN